MAAEVCRIFGIVPAAGQSRRMGTAKQLLDVGGRPMLRAVVEAVAAAMVAGVAVIVHGEIARQAGIAGIAGAAIIRNDDASSEMIDSVRMGVRHWINFETMLPGDGFLVCPGDQPGIATADIDRCIAAFRDDPARIVVASHGGRRGHPVIFGREFVESVLGSECDGGLNALPRRHGGVVNVVECTSRGVTWDVDTPGDYRELGEY